MRRLGLLWILLLTLFCLTLSIPVGAEETDHTKPPPHLDQNGDGEVDVPGGNRGSGGGSDDDDDDDDEGGKWYIPDWLEEAMKKMAETAENVAKLWDNMTKLMTPEGIKELFQGFIVTMVDEAMAPVLGIFGAAFLKTPELAHYSFVHNNWSRVAVLSLPLVLFSLVVSLRQALKGRRGMEKIWKSAAVGLIFLFASLTVIHWLIIFQNYVTQKAVAGILEADIEMEALTGVDVLKAMMAGSKALTDPELKMLTLGQLIVMPENGGLMGLLGTSTFVVFPLFLIVFCIVMVLMGLTILVDLWCAYAVFRGREEVVYGWLNLFLRTLVSCGMFPIVWAIMVSMQDRADQGEGIVGVTGVNPLIYSCILLLVLIVLLYFFWAKPAYQAARHPLELNGGAVIENMGKMQQKASEVMMDVGKRYGMSEWQKKSLDWKARGKNWEEKGRMLKEQQLDMGNLLREKMASKATRGGSEVIQGMRYQEPKRWVEHQGAISMRSAGKKDVFAIQKAAHFQAFEHYVKTHLKDQAWTQTLEWDAEQKQIRVAPEHQQAIQQAFSQFQQTQIPDEGRDWVQHKGTTGEAKPIVKREVFSLPKGAAFMKQLEAHLKTRHANDEWMKRTVFDNKEQKVFLHPEDVPAFQQALLQFEKHHTPYWTDRHGSVIVLDDGIPVNIGYAPENGIHMGSFEKLQTETMMQQQSNKQKKPQTGGKEARDGTNRKGPKA